MVVHHQGRAHVALWEITGVVSARSDHTTQSQPVQVLHRAANEQDTREARTKVNEGHIEVIYLFIYLLFFITEEYTCMCNLCTMYAIHRN